MQSGGQDVIETVAPGVPRRVHAMVRWRRPCVADLSHNAEGLFLNTAARVAWVTGASSGIGRALALQLAAAGWRVAVSARRRAVLEELAAEADGPGALAVFPLDVTDAVATGATVAAIEAELGPIELAVLNAGDYRPMPVADFDATLFRRLMAVNYLGLVHGLDALLPRLRQRRRGELMLMGSVAGYRGLPLAGPYGPTKAAIINLAETLACELHGSGVRVRLINPGFVRSPLTDRNDFPMPARISAEAAAARIVAAIGGRGFEISFPRRFTYAMKLLRLLPYAVALPLLRRLTRGT